ncbi:hypothetical protein [Streptomyces sp. CoH17]|uniref:hypothetical protein n=1 Tax=Streptomyces sp. CoH17 TaxID=2992806 RepID=UPI002271A389|nr:hypothetical protein [Streptomyces sp. CoH17]
MSRAAIISDRWITGLSAEVIADIGALWHGRQSIFDTGSLHDALVCGLGVDPSTIARAIGEARPLLAERGCTVSSDVRLRSPAGVVNRLGASGSTGISDGTEIR